LGDYQKRKLSNNNKVLDGSAIVYNKDNRNQSLVGITKKKRFKKVLGISICTPLFAASSMKKGIHAWGLPQKRALTKTRFLVLAFVLSLLSATLFEKRN